MVFTITFAKSGLPIPILIVYLLANSRGTLWRLTEAPLCLKAAYCWGRSVSIRPFLQSVPSTAFASFQDRRERLELAARESEIRVMRCSSLYLLRVAYRSWNGWVLIQRLTLFIGLFRRLAFRCISRSFWMRSLSLRGCRVTLEASTQRWFSLRFYRTLHSLCQLPCLLKNHLLVVELTSKPLGWPLQL